MMMNGRNTKEASGCLFFLFEVAHVAIRFPTTSLMPFLSDKNVRTSSLKSTGPCVFLSCIRIAEHCYFSTFQSEQFSSFVSAKCRQRDANLTVVEVLCPALCVRFYLRRNARPCVLYTGWLTAMSQ